MPCIFEEAVAVERVAGAPSGEAEFDARVLAGGPKARGDEICIFLTGLACIACASLCSSCLG